MPDSKDRSPEETEHLVEDVYQRMMESTESVAPSRIPRGRLLLSLGLVHTFILLLYAAISGIIINRTCRSCENSRNAIGGLSLEFEFQQFMTMHESPYVGIPSPHVDEAWQKLLAGMNTRVTKEELDQQGQMSVELPDGGYLAWLGVFHELHCTKMLRQLNYRDFYHPNMTIPQFRDWQVHADHCIEFLRASAMCRPDTASLTTFAWDRKRSKPMLRNERPSHRCVDWSRLTQSVRHRMVEENEFQRMVQRND